MDLIGSIKYIESRFGGRKSGHNKAKPVQKDTRNEVAEEKGVTSDASYPSAEFDIRLGRKVNVTV